MLILRCPSVSAIEAVAKLGMDASSIINFSQFENVELVAVANHELMWTVLRLGRVEVLLDCITRLLDFRYQTCFVRGECIRNSFGELSQNIGSVQLAKNSTAVFVIAETTTSQASEVFSALIKLVLPEPTGPDSAIVDFP